MEPSWGALLGGIITCAWFGLLIVVLGQMWFELDEKDRHKKRGDGFYRTPEWKAERRPVIDQSPPYCPICGVYIREGFNLHVDHILPRSRYPELALTRSNLRVLCKECNMQKGPS